MAPEPHPRERCFLSRASEDTEALGEALGRGLESGTVIALDGELGAGKTCFVRGLARGLGVGRAIVSPTYALMHEYDGRRPLYHFDAWLEGREKAWFLEGGGEFLGAEGVAVVEWAERVAELLPEPRLAVLLEHVGPSERRIRLRVVGVEGESGGLGRVLARLEAPVGLMEEAPGGARSDPGRGHEPPSGPSVGVDL